MRVCNKDCLPLGIDRCDATPTPTGFAQIISDNFPLHHLELLLLLERLRRTANSTTSSTRIPAPMTFKLPTVCPTTTSFPPPSACRRPGVCPTTTTLLP